MDDSKFKNEDGQATSYDMLSNLRDYLEDVRVSNGNGPGDITLELDQDEISWILDQIYFAKKNS